MIRVLYLVIAILVALGGLAFHVRNNRVISLDYFAGTLNIQLSWMLVGILVLGVVLGSLAMTGKLLRQRHEISRLKRSKADMERELNGLRTVALKDAG